MQTVQGKIVYIWNFKHKTYVKATSAQLQAWNAKLKTKRRNTQVRNIDFDLTLKDFMFLSMIPYCEYTGDPLSDSGASGRSIERIDGNIGYTIDNVCVTSVRANQLSESITFAKTIEDCSISGIYDEVILRKLFHNRNLIGLNELILEKYSDKKFQECYIIVVDSKPENEREFIKDAVYNRDIVLQEYSDKRNNLKSIFDNDVKIKEVALNTNKDINKDVVIEDTQLIQEDEMDTNNLNENNNLDEDVLVETQVAEKYLEAVKLATNHKVKFSLSLSDFKKLSLTKNCKLSGLPLENDRRFFFLKDRSLGFSKGNVVVVDKGIGLVLNAKNKGDDGHKVINRIGKNIQKLFS